MQIQELEQIINTMDTDIICKALEDKGYRLANPDGVKEFDVPIVAEDESNTTNVSVEDVFDDKLYRATIHKNMKEYDGITFIWFVVSKLIRRPDITLPIPWKMFLYTDAPINEEYEKFQAEIICCEKCKRKDQRKKMLSLYEKTLCPKCFVKELRKQSKGIIIPD